MKRIHSGILAGLRPLARAASTICLLIAGCGQTLSTGGAAASQPAAQNAAPAAAPVPTSSDTNPPLRPTVIVTNITFDVLRVRAPQGMFSRSGKIWNHLETDFLTGETIKVLHRNGLRAGRGNADSWPPVKALLETEPRVQISQSRLTLNNGLPLLLELDQKPKDQLLFLYRRDGTLAGAPWKSTTNILRIEYGIAPTNAEAMLLEIAPELRLDSSNLRNAELHDLTQARADHSLVVRDLSFQTELAAGQFVAFGPSPVTNELPYVMGSLLLCDEQNGDKYESMYFLTPTISRTGG